MFNVMDLVKVVNFHGEPIAATYALGEGRVVEVYTNAQGENMAAIQFADCEGNWPIECVRPVTVIIHNPPLGGGD